MRQLLLSSLKRWGPVLPIAAALVAHTLYFDFLTDDAYISFVYARNFAEHNELTFNLGDRVEGYTNFLWTLVLGLLMKLGIPPEWSSKALGSAFGIATLALVVRLSARIRGRPSSWDYLPAALLAVSSGFACWCSGGLETQMFTFFVTLGIVWALEDKPPRAGIALALAALTRPEGGLVFAVIVLHRLLSNLLGQRRLLPRRSEWLAVALFAAIYLPYFAWRWWYYGYPFPNTFYVKTGGTSPQYVARVWSYGGFYVWQWAKQSGALFAAPLLLLALRRYPRYITLALLLSASYLLYTARVGGDFMGLHRFVMPLFVTTTLGATLGLTVLVGWMPRRLRPLLGIAAAAAVLGVLGWTQARLSRISMIPRADHGIDRPGYLKLYTHDRALLGKALRPLLRPDDFSIVGGTGVQPYYARMRAVDVFGLVSEEIAHGVRAHNPRPGHQIWAPAGMLLSTYNPTFIFHCYDLHHHPQRYRLCGEAGFFRSRGYEEVTMHVPGLRERGQYYTFLKRRDRELTHPSILSTTR